MFVLAQLKKIFNTKSDKKEDNINNSIENMHFDYRKKISAQFLLKNYRNSTDSCEKNIGDLMSIKLHRLVKNAFSPNLMIKAQLYLPKIWWKTISAQALLKTIVRNFMNEWHIGTDTVDKNLCLKNLPIIVFKEIFKEIPMFKNLYIWNLVIKEQSYLLKKD